MNHHKLLKKNQQFPNLNWISEAKKKIKLLFHITGFNVRISIDILQTTLTATQTALTCFIAAIGRSIGISICVILFKEMKQLINIAMDKIGINKQLIQW